MLLVLSDLIYTYLLIVLWVGKEKGKVYQIITNFVVFFLLWKAWSPIDKLSIV